MSRSLVGTDDEWGRQRHVNVKSHPTNIKVRNYFLEKIKKNRILSLQINISCIATTWEGKDNSVLGVGEGIGISMITIDEKKTSR